MIYQHWTNVIFTDYVAQVSWLWWSIFCCWNNTENSTYEYGKNAENPLESTCTYWDNVEHATYWQRLKLNMYIQTGIHKLHVNNKEMFDFKNVFQQKYDYFMTSFNKNQRDPAWIEWSVGVGMTISVNAYSTLKSDVNATAIF